jgi:hypothetical protein
MTAFGTDATTQYQSFTSFSTIDECIRGDFFAQRPASLGAGG